MRQKPLDTPRGFADPAKAVQCSTRSAADIEKQYGSLHVKWGDVLRLRRGSIGPARQRRALHDGRDPDVDFGPFVDGKAGANRGDTSYAVVEFSTPVHAEALLGLRQLVEAGFETRRRSTPAILEEADAPRVARAERNRGQS